MTGGLSGKGRLVLLDIFMRGNVRAGYSALRRFPRMFTPLFAKGGAGMFISGIRLKQGITQVLTVILI
ncbi:MAG: hypothetical protein DM484_30265 [Candidatus Methylumidiphilus alinenensis]|uniref:Uncharacterized protein n=1 Tax=Candidatus Methylumidiphilus alinenensis TaxID=2202197 RepID=A0A2W4SBK5_9GAMM|nr:MAG: hypothetical protein DM484_30265 [Candidatus Methylumidiphilus alinenensis]